MKIYKKMMIQGLIDKQVLLFENAQVDIAIHQNEGAIKINGGQGNAPIGMVGGRSYYSVHCFDIGCEAKNKFDNQKVNVFLDDNDSQNQISNVSMQYRGNVITIETEKMKIVTLK